MIPLIIIRAQQGCDATLAAARGLGLNAFGFPLFAIRPLAWDAPPRDSFDALLIGSANALRHGGGALADWRGAPAYAVGETTAEAARAAGLDVIATGEGGLQALLGTLKPDHRRLLRLAGQKRVALAAPPGVILSERIVYASEAQPMPAVLAAMLKKPCVVLLHSAEAAHHFAGQCDTHAIPRRRIALAALGPRIAAAVGDGWAAVTAAVMPHDHALLELAGEMCQTLPDDSHDTAGLMQDDLTDDHPLPPAPPRRRTGRRLLWALVLLLLIVLAIALAAFRYPDVERELGMLLGGRPPGAPVRIAEDVAPGVPPAAIQPTPPAMLATGLETRMALLEERLSRLGLRAEAATGNAARAEGLLIAFAARRTLDRGAQLGYLEDQLRLRFADAQPNAVETLIEAAHAPTTLDQLYGELAALTPRLTGIDRSEDSWSKVKREFTSLFVIRRVSEPLRRPQDRIEHAKLLLGSGKVTEAIAEVEQLPGASAAGPWITSARRYDAVQRALDLIETTAMLEPRRLRDGDGAAVEQLSPLAEPPMVGVPGV